MFKKLPLGNFVTNCYVIAEDATKEAAVIDPADDFEEIKDFIEEHGLKVKYILLTHAHGDHILALPQLKEYTGASVGIHQEDEPMLQDAALNMSGYFAQPPVEAKADFHLKDEQVIMLGASEVKVLHTPGHSKGSVCILFEKELMSGDTLFANGIGRTDFYGGDYDSLVRSVRSKLFILPGDVRVHPGHDSSSTISIEREGNPFLR